MDVSETAFDPGKMAFEFDPIFFPSLLSTELSINSLPTFSETVNGLFSSSLKMYSLSFVRWK